MYVNITMWTTSEFVHENLTKCTLLFVVCVFSVWWSWTINLNCALFFICRINSDLKLYLLQFINSVIWSSYSKNFFKILRGKVRRSRAWKFPEKFYTNPFTLLAKLIIFRNPCSIKRVRLTFSLDKSYEFNFYLGSHLVLCRILILHDLHSIWRNYQFSFFSLAPSSICKS